MEFDPRGDFSDIVFDHCEYCGGPTLGHRATKCHYYGNGYAEEVVKRLECWLKGNHEFRRAVREKRLKSLAAEIELINRLESLAMELEKLMQDQE